MPTAKVQIDNLQHPNGSHLLHLWILKAQRNSIKLEKLWPCRYYLPAIFPHLSEVQVFLIQGRILMHKGKSSAA